MQFGGSTKLHRKSGFGLHQLRNRSSRYTYGETALARAADQQDPVG